MTKYYVNTRSINLRPGEKPIVFNLSRGSQILDIESIGNCAFNFHCLSLEKMLEEEPWTFICVHSYGSIEIEDPRFLKSFLKSVTGWTAPSSDNFVNFIQPGGTNTLYASTQPPRQLIPPYMEVKYFLFGYLINEPERNNVISKLPSPQQQLF